MVSSKLHVANIFRRDALPPLTDKVKQMKIKNPIVQHINGNTGIYRQTNLEKQRTYNLAEWRRLCDAEDHQPPAKRGERRRNADARRITKRRVKSKRNQRNGQQADDVATKLLDDKSLSPSRVMPEAPLTPPTPNGDTAEAIEGTARREEELWKDFDYKLNSEEFTPERCQELEKVYWKTLTYNTPLYGADMPGSLFDKETKDWNVAHLDNILNILGRKLPGVNAAYLYLGMWKATFSWHVEDMDLYSINYIHFGAPKQWYSISQCDAPKFENVMRNIWPDEYKKCSQYLRHKSFLISPSMLAQHGIEVNKMVHNEGEFVITFPFGYHSGYNLGYNCAESVNFATDAWLDYGRDAMKCNCIPDAVWINVDDIIARLNGDIVDGPYDLPTPPASEEGGLRPTKRQRLATAAPSDILVRKAPIIKLPDTSPCCLCPNEVGGDILPTSDGRKAHRICAALIPETYVGFNDNLFETIYGVKQIAKARTELKCMYCHRREGACFQCGAGKCVRSYHPTCAPMAGVLVEGLEDENGLLWNLKCRFHRPKRALEAVENDPAVEEYGASLTAGETVQAQYEGGEIFAGTVVENCLSERQVLLDVLVGGDRIELDWKWLLCPTGKQTRSFAKRSVKEQGIQSTLAAARVIADAAQFSIQWDEPEVVAVEKLPQQQRVTGESFWFYIEKASTLSVDRYSDHPDNHKPTQRGDVNMCEGANGRRMTALEKVEARRVQEMRYAEAMRARQAQARSLPQPQQYSQWSLPAFKRPTFQPPAFQRPTFQPSSSQRLPFQPPDFRPPAFLPRREMAAPSPASQSFHLPQLSMDDLIAAAFSSPRPDVPAAAKSGPSTCEYPASFG